MDEIISQNLSLFQLCFFIVFGKSSIWKILKLTVTAALRRYILFTFVWTGMIVFFPIQDLGYDTVTWLIINVIIVFAVIIILLLSLSYYFGRKSLDFVSVTNLQINLTFMMVVKAEVKYRVIFQSKYAGHSTQIKVKRVL